MWAGLEAVATEQDVPPENVQLDLSLTKGFLYLNVSVIVDAQPDPFWLESSLCAVKTSITTTAK